MNLYYHNKPEFTQGGNKEAEIATPTRDEVLRPDIARATPTPEGKAIKKPNIKLWGSPLFTISAVGQPGQILPRDIKEKGVPRTPTTIPHTN